MRRLIYSPKAYCYIQTDVQTYNISDLVVSGSVSRKINQISTAEVVFQNPYRQFTTPGDPTFRPMDKILIFLQRLSGFPVLAFTGYLDSAPYYQMYPGTCSVTASCTLKRLQYTYLDPGLPFMNQFLARYGWITDGNGSISNPASSTGVSVAGTNSSTTSNNDPASGSSSDPNPSSTSTTVRKEASNRIYDKAVQISNKNYPYVYGGGHGSVGVPSGGGFDCSGYILAILAAGGYLKSPLVASDFASSWGEAGEGEDFTVWANSDHVFMTFVGRNGKRADTSPHGSGPLGPHVRYAVRLTAGFTPRRPSGDPGSIAGPNTLDPGLNTSTAVTNDSVLAPIQNITENVADVAQSASIGELLFACLKHIAGWDPSQIYIEELPDGLVEKIAGIYSQIEKDDQESLTQFQNWLKDYIGVTSSGSGGTAAPDSSGIDIEPGGGGKKVGASDYGGPNDPGAYMHTTASGKIMNDTLVGFAELSTDPQNGVHADFSALGKLPMGTKLRITYKGKSIVAPKVDVGAGGDAVDGYPRSIDLTYPLAQKLGFDGLGVVQIERVADSLDPQTSLGTLPDPNSTQTKTSKTKGSDSLTLDPKIFAPIPGWSGAIGGAYGDARTSPHPHIHAGVDVDVPRGTNCVAPCDGEIGMTIAGGFAPGEGGPDGAGGGMVHFIFTKTVGSIQLGTVIGWGHIYDLKVKKGDKVRGGQILAKSGWTSGGDHVHFIVRHDDDALDGYQDKSMDPTPVIKALDKGDTSNTGTTPENDANAASAGGNVSGTPDALVAAKAASVFTTLNFPQAVDSAESLLLTGEKSLMNDQPLLPFVEQLAQGSIRSFMSLPNGDFYAFHPDYFGTLGTAPYFEIDDVEVLDGNIQLNDEALATHMYVVGATFPTQDINIVNELETTGVVTILNAGNADFLNFKSDGEAAKKAGAKENDDDSQSFLTTYQESLDFLKRYGARPVVEQAPFIRSHVFETFYAYQKFMLAWSRQFMTTFSFTFMPEIFPGGLVSFKSHGIQMFVDEVHHSWDYTSGFTTQANLSAPSAIDSKDINMNQISRGMVRATTVGKTS